MKNYLVYVESVDDFEVTEPSYRLFKEKKDAQEYFLTQMEMIEEDGIDNGWDVEQTETSYSIFEEGRYPENHVTVRFVELEVE